MNGIVDKARIDYGPDWDPPENPSPSPPVGDAGISVPQRTTHMDFIKKLITFAWMKDWRTAIIVIFVLGAYGVETFFGIDIPKVDFTWQDVLLALGLGTAAVHEVKK